MGPVLDLLFSNELAPQGTQMTEIYGEFDPTLQRVAGRFSTATQACPYGKQAVKVWHLMDRAAGSLIRMRE